jgi:uncharacterized protein (DUF486 family)
MPQSFAAILPIILLSVSNVFMTFAWYGHLKFKDQPLWIVVFVSWGIAFIEYCFAVPANRWGHGTYSAAELKTIQEMVTLVVFAVFSVLYLGEAIKWNHVAGFACLVLAAVFIFREW